MDLDRIPASERKALLDRLKRDLEVLGSELVRPEPTVPLSPISDLAKKVLKARNRDGLTQDALAELADVSVVVVGKIERDREGITLTTLMKVCNALGIKVWLE